MKFHILVFLAIIFLTANLLPVSAQIDSVLGQITSSDRDVFAGGMSGDGRFVVFESSGNIATVNPRNSDNNREIFLFDYAQRRIFQITDTKSLLIDTTKTSTFDNIKVDIVNIRPAISTNGRWIVFGSNATTSTPAAPNNTNPGSFNANSFTAADGTNPLTADGNTEMWLYFIPAAPAADLSSGAETAITDLSTGTFTRVTNTLPSRLPAPGSASAFPIIADDNRDASTNDNSTLISFTSNRDLAPCTTTASATCGNANPNFDNDEIFVYSRTANVISQITATPRGTVASPTTNLNSTISGNGLRVTFVSNANNPIVGMTGGTNSDLNGEIYYADLDANGSPTGTKKQVTATTRTNAGDVLNILNFGRRMSRDGRYIAFDSYADLANENSGTNQASFALYLYDATLNTFRRIGPRSDADTTATGGDIAHFPGFTDTDANGTPQTLLLETRLNITAAGAIPATASDGLNPDTTRQTQIYSYPLNVAAASATFTRLAKLPSPSSILAQLQPLPSNSVRRLAFNLSNTEVGAGNADLTSETYYLLTPAATTTTASTTNFFTGASRIPVSASPVPTPTASPSPTPQTPDAVQGISNGMLAIAEYTSGSSLPAATVTATGSLSRRFTLPIELAGVTMTINGVACGLKSVSQNQVVFVVPPALTIDSTTNTSSYSFVINNNGFVTKGTLTIVPARPDIFTNLATPGPGGRARIFNATNTVLTGEPFVIRTRKLKGGLLVPSVLRLYLTGVNNLTAANYSISVVSGTTSTTINGASIVSDSVLREPGIYSIDFTLPATLLGAGDVPITVSVTVNGVTYVSRAQDTAPRFRIL